MTNITMNTGAASLLPCPFCGSEAAVNHQYQWWVQCTNEACGAVQNDAPMDKDSAIAAWNRRATPQADAAIAAGGAQEASKEAESKLPEYSGCIEWSNYKNRQGYGSLKADGQMSLAHRVMYCDYHGVTRDSIKHLVVRHACDNPSCFNPAHLLLGTHADNTKDKIERGRHARGERNGQSKLSRHQAAQIRSLYVRGSREFGIPALAKKFGVGQSTIREVVLNLRWTEENPSNGEQA
jgi:hypothetical protein